MVAALAIAAAGCARVADAGSADPSRTATARPGGSLPDSVPFGAPPVGTRFNTTAGGYLQITAVEGMTVTTVNPANRTAPWLAGFLFEPGLANTKAVEAVWPLQVGKTIVFEQHLGMDGWRHTVKVLRKETLQVPAGTYQTLVVEELIESMMPAQGNLSVSKFYWYAPDVHWPVKYESVQHSGPPVPGTAAYTIASSTRP